MTRKKRIFTDLIGARSVRSVSSVVYFLIFVQGNFKAENEYQAAQD